MVGNGASASASITSVGNITCVGLATCTLIANGIGGLAVYSDIVKKHHQYHKQARLLLSQCLWLTQALL